MSEFNNSWIENVVQSKIEKEVAAMQQDWDQKTQDFLNTVEQKIKVFEQHSREVRITFEEINNTKLNEMFNKKTEELILKIEEANKKYRIVKEKYSINTENELDGDFEQRIIFKMDEKIEAKSEELSVTFQAQVIKKLEQVMALYQQILNNGLEFDKHIVQELTEDINKENKERKTIVLLEQSFNEWTARLIVDYKNKGATASEQILTNKLNNLQSENQNNDEVSSLNEHIMKLKDMIEKNAKDVEVLNIKLEQIEKLFTMQNFRESVKCPENGSYTNWDIKCECSILFYNVSDIEMLLHKFELMHDNIYHELESQVTERQRMLANIKMYVVDRTTRFPSSGKFIRCDDRVLRGILQEPFTQHGCYRVDAKTAEIRKWSSDLQLFEEESNLKWVANGQ